MPRLIRRRTALSAIAAVIAAAAVWAAFARAPVDAAGPGPEASALDPDTFHTLVQPFLEEHCHRCHNEDRQRGDLRLDDLGIDFQTARTQGIWLEVMDNLNLGEMPPPDSPSLPSVDEIQPVTDWIAAELRHAERLALGAGDRVLLRRMNRSEYANTLRDLLAVTFLPGDNPLDQLPADGTAEGFDKVSSALMLDQSLLETYYLVAREVVDRALVTGPPEFPTDIMRMEMEDIARNRAIEYICSQPGVICADDHIVLMTSSTRSFGRMKYGDTRDEIPVAGLYHVRVRAWGLPGADGEPVRMRFTQNHPEADRRLLIETDVTETPTLYETTMPRDPDGGEYNVTIVNGTNFFSTNQEAIQLRRAIEEAGVAGDYVTSIRLAGRKLLEGHAGSRPNPDAVDPSQLPRLFIDYIEVEGPLYESWPPASHRTIFFDGREQEPDLDYARDILLKFMPRAFRRPLQPGEEQPYLDLVQGELDHGGSFIDAVGLAVSAVLTSPAFLYLLEPATADDLAGSDNGVPSPAPRPLDDWELASRLSYFIWSSMPDEQLFELAAAGRLSDPDILTAEIGRMLEDDKAEALVQDFGAQWMKVHEFRAFMPDERLYREFDAALGEAMEQEALAFFRRVLRESLPVTEFLDSDWTMANRRLAEFYQLPREAASETEFVPVTLPPDSPRGGLLGMAGVAMFGSDGNRTKPVNRGVYVREVLFNDPPNPPPPNAGEVEPNIEGENLTVRDRLIQHQQVETCAACHRRIDPYGLAMENFNVIGAWREQQDGEDFRGRNTPAIDASGTLPNGLSFETFEEFKALLFEQQDRFRRALAEKMLVYALGRPLVPADRSLIEHLADQMQHQGDTLHTLIQAVATSDAFRYK